MTRRLAQEQRARERMLAKTVHRYPVECWRCKWQGLLAENEVCPICKQEDQLHEDTNAPQ